LDTAGKFSYDERDFPIDFPPLSDVLSALLGAAIVAFALVLKTKDPLLSESELCLERLEVGALYRWKNKGRIKVCFCTWVPNKIDYCQHVTSFKD